jgi:hypothetical protein
MRASPIAILALAFMAAHAHDYRGLATTQELATTGHLPTRTMTLHARAYAFIHRADVYFCNGDYDDAISEPDPKLLAVGVRG